MPRTREFRQQRTLTRNAMFAHRNVHVSMRVDRYAGAVGEYEVSAFVRYHGGSHIVTQDFFKVDGETVNDTARKIVEMAINDAYEDSANADAVYVVVNDLPGFAEDRLKIGRSKTCRKAAYIPFPETENGVTGPALHPLTVVRCENQAAADEFQAKADLRQVRDGARRFSPTVTGVYPADQVLTALDGASWNASDLATYLQALPYDSEA